MIVSCKKTSVSPKEKHEPGVSQKDFQRIQEEGRLVALLDNSSTSYFLYKGNPMGFEYDLLREFCNDYNLELQVKVVSNMDQILSLLEHRKGDVAAANLTVTADRMHQVNFTAPILYTKQVLIQRKLMKSEMVMEPTQLDDKIVHVRKQSSFYKRLRNLAQETGNDIIIRTVPGNKSVEDLAYMVSTGDIDYTVADDNVAKILDNYYNNLYIGTELSTKQKIAWAVRKESTMLRDTLSAWINSFRKTKKFKAIYARYFKSKGSFSNRIESEYYADVSGKISPYDDLIQKYSKTIGWDWKLLASLIYQESHFNPHARSMGGAFGLMQLMPATARQFGIDTNAGVAAQIKTGCKLLGVLDKRLSDLVPDSVERVKYVMAAYNAGLGHVLDAYRLTEKYDGDPTKWENVSRFIELKTKPKYYTDPVVKSGYCRCYITAKYVREIMHRYQHYENLVNEDVLALN